MAKQKHAAPLEDSDDELQVPKPQPEQEDSSEEEDEATSSDEDTDEGEDERDKHVQVPRKPQPQMVSEPSSSSSSSEDESDSEPEPKPEREREALLENAKPSSKLKSQPSSAVSQAKSGSSSAVSQAKSVSKRAAKNSIDHSNQPKRGKKAQEDHAAGPDEEDPKKSRDESKSLFQRVFSEKDEIGILKGLSKFIAKTGKEPYKCADEFYDFIRGSNLIEANASCTQMKDKIHRLKKKFENNLAKENKGKGTTLKPHEMEVLRLGKNVWGHDGGKAAHKEALKEDKVNNEKVGKSTPKKAEAKAKLNFEPLDSNEGIRMSELSGTSLALTSMLRYDGTFAKPYGEDYIRKGLELLGVSKREEIEARWRKFKDAENKLGVEIAEFYAEQAKLIYQANSSSSS